jgi:cyclic pyranopterin monophosphate synthase
MARRVVTTQCFKRVSHVRSTSQSCFSSGIFTHISGDGERPTMVDVGNKVATLREAMASCKVKLPEETLIALGVHDVPESIRNTKDIIGKKGPVITAAIIAGVMGAKKTSELIPFCHPLPLDFVDIKIDWHSRNELKVQCLVKVRNSTGVEMEALTGASTAALCVYDMLKASSHNIQISELQLESKVGGKRLFKRDENKR